jgi:hypothetical protein
VQRAANLADDPDADRHSGEKIFPRLGETATTAEILAVLGT